MRHIINILAIVGAWQIYAPTGAYGEAPLPPLEIGQGFNDVIKLWGAPKDKEEQEAKRVNIWRYGKAQVTFQDGRVAYWSDPQMGEASVIRPINKSVNNNSVGSPGLADDKGADSAVVEEILAEIMKEPPSSDAPADPSVPVVPVPGQPVIQPPAALPPAAMPPAEVIN